MNYGSMVMYLANNQFLCLNGYWSVCVCEDLRMLCYFVHHDHKLQNPVYIPFLFLEMVSSSQMIMGYLLGYD